MLFPQAAFVEKGQEVVVRYQWGHPFEHQLFNAPDPQRLMVLGPDGQKTDLTAKLEKIVQPSGAQEKIMTFQLRYRPDQRGDYLFVLTTPPIWMEEEQEFFKDVVKVVLHVQAQKGWDASAGEVLEWLPLTRPYGLQPGMVMQAQFLAEQKPLGGTLVEIEKYNAVPPKKLPPDEHITRTSKTDLNGIVTTTLPEAGWWGLTAGRENGKREHQGKMYPLRQRSTFWLHVDGPIRFTEEKKDDSP
jgi:uncharacterized GH25 family protein